MTKEELNDGIKRIPAKDSPWGKFLLDAIERDFNDKGDYHLFARLYYLHTKLKHFPNFDIQKIYNNVSDSKKRSLESSVNLGGSDNFETRMAVNILLNSLGNPKQIDEIDLSNLIFEDDIDFSNFVFPTKVSFRNTVFSKITDFSDAIFFENTNLSIVKFYTKVDFSKTKFYTNVDFSKTTFFENAKFNHTEFFMFAEFNGTCFSSTVEFFKAQLSIAEFKKTVFNGFANFSDTTFTKMANFKEAIFSSQARFNNAKFLGYTTFENTTFELNAPRFYGAELNDEMFWNDIKLPTLEKVGDKELEDNYKKRIKDNENAYENLSTKLGNQKKYRDELFFFRQELNCQRKLAESITSGFAFRLYELFSGYGYNIGRAFWCWVGHMVLGVLVIAFISMCGGMRFHESLTCAIPVSVANANPYVFFGFESSSLKDCYTKLDEIASISFAAVKVIQTLFGIALLSLVIITLRTRFRLK